MSHKTVLECGVGGYGGRDAGGCTEGVETLHLLRGEGAGVDASVVDGAVKIASTDSRISPYLKCV
jgi:hypothetical protein